MGCAGAASPASENDTRAPKAFLAASAKTNLPPDHPRSPSGPPLEQNGRFTWHARRRYTSLRKRLPISGEETANPKGDTEVAEL